MPKEVDWGDIITAFDPLARVEQEQQALYVERPEAVAAEIMGKIKLYPRGKWIFCGSTGTGKSSELVHLAAKMKEDYLVIALDLPRSVNNPKIIQPFEVLTLVGAAAILSAKESLGYDVPDALVSDLIACFKGVAIGRGLEVDAPRLLKGVALFAWGVATQDLPSGVEGAVAIGGAVRRASPPRHRTPLGGLTRTNLREDDPEVLALTEAVNTILDHLGSELSRIPLVLVDGLDKVDEIQNIRNLFTETRLLTSLRAPTVYTAPIPLMLDTEWQTAGELFKHKRLTNLLVAPPKWKPVDDRIQKLIDDGRSVARQVIASRLSSLGYELADIISDDALEALITASGGLLRSLIRLFQVSIEHAFERRSPRIELVDVHKTMSLVSKEYGVTMTTARLDEIRHVLNNGMPSGKSSSFELLIGNYVLPYANGAIWWAPTPLVASLLPG